MGLLSSWRWAGPGTPAGPNPSSPRGQPPGPARDGPFGLPVGRQEPFVDRMDEIGPPPTGGIGPKGTAKTALPPVGWPARGRHEGTSQDSARETHSNNLARPERGRFARFKVGEGVGGSVLDLDVLYF